MKLILTEKDIEIIKLLYNPFLDDFIIKKHVFPKAMEFGWLKLHSGCWYKVKNKEREECEVIMTLLNIDIPWESLDYV